MNAYQVQNVVTYDTIIEFDNPEEKLLPGMTAYVTIPVASARDIVKIPNGSLRYRPELSESERRTLLEKYGLLPQQTQTQEAQLASPAGSPQSQAGNQAQASERGSQGQGRQEAGTDSESREARRARFMAMRGQQGGAARPEGMMGPRPDAATQREGEWQIVWKLTPDKQLRPVRIRTGITDYTYTAMVEGDLKPGDKLIIGQTSNRRAQVPGGMGGVPGIPRRF
jgi:HlyD family secretion protein